MAGYYPGSVPMTGFIAPTHLNDTYSTHKADFGQGGYKVVFDTAERDAITPERRADGMMVYVLNQQVEYRLVGGITNSCWAPVPETDANLKRFLTVDETLPEVPGKRYQTYAAAADYIQLYWTPEFYRPYIVLISGTLNEDIVLRPHIHAASHPSIGGFINGKVTTGPTYSYYDYVAKNITIKTFDVTAATELFLHTVLVTDQDATAGTGSLNLFDETNIWAVTNPDINFLSLTKITVWNSWVNQINKFTEIELNTDSYLDIRGTGAAGNVLVMNNGALELEADLAVVNATAIQSNIWGPHVLNTSGVSEIFQSVIREIEISAAGDTLTTYGCCASGGGKFSESGGTWVNIGDVYQRKTNGPEADDMQAAIDSMIETYLINTDKTIYVASTGDDTTGDGSSGSPYLTIGKALTMVEDNLIVSNVTIELLDAGPFEFRFSEDASEISRIKAYNSELFIKGHYSSVVDGVSFTQDGTYKMNYAAQKIGYTVDTDDLKGKFVEDAANKRLIPIAGNTNGMDNFDIKWAREDRNGVKNIVDTDSVINIVVTGEDPGFELDFKYNVGSRIRFMFVDLRKNDGSFHMENNPGTLTIEYSKIFSKEAYVLGQWTMGYYVDMPFNGVYFSSDATAHMFELRRFPGQLKFNRCVIDGYNCIYDHVAIMLFSSKGSFTQLSETFILGSDRAWAIELGSGIIEIKNTLEIKNCLGALDLMDGDKVLASSDDTSDDPANFNILQLIGTPYIFKKAVNMTSAQIDKLVKDGSYIGIFADSSTGTIIPERNIHIVIAGESGGYVPINNPMVQSLGLVPVGAIMPVLPGYFTGPGNTGYTNGLLSGVGTEVEQVNAYYNKYGYHVCNGALLNDPESTCYNGAGRYLPEISDDRFICGGTSLGGVGGSNVLTDHTHTHSLTAGGQSFSGNSPSVGAHNHNGETVLTTVSYTGNSPSVGAHNHAGSSGTSAPSTDAVNLSHRHWSTHDHGGFTGTDSVNHSHGYSAPSPIPGGSLLFVAGSGGTNIYDDAFSTGGVNQSHQHSIIAAPTYTDYQLGSHSHTVSSHNHSISAGTAPVVSLDHSHGQHNHTINAGTAPTVSLNHSHGASGVTGAIGTNQAPGSTDNRPKFIQSIYLIRIK